jgi:hypothetical protein
MLTGESSRESISAVELDSTLARAVMAKLNLDLILTIGLGLAAALLSLKYDMLQQPFPPDPTLHVYAAQQILQGHVIYRDVGIIKAPLSDFVAAFAIVGLQPFGVPDWLATRLVFWVVAAATVGMTYLTARFSFGNRTVGFMSALGMLSYGYFNLRAVTGPEPKSLLILFSLAAFTLLQKRRWGWAGVCAGLAAMAWQPGLMVVALVLAASLLTPISHSAEGLGETAGGVTTPLPPRRMFVTSAVRVLQNLRGRSFLAALLGAVAPWSLLIIYLVANSALLPAWDDMIGANWVSFSSPAAQGPSRLLSVNLPRIFAIGGRVCFAQEQPLVILGLAGFVGIVVYELLSARSRGHSLVNLERTPLILYTLGFGAFTLIDFDFCPDLIPLLPVSAIGFGWLLWQVTAGIRRIWQRRVSTWSGRSLQAVLLTFVGLLSFAVTLSHTLEYTLTGATLHDQVEIAVFAQQYLKPEDRVLAFGDASILIFTHRTNASKVLSLGAKSGFGVLAFEPDHMKGLVRSLDGDPPKLIALSREPPAALAKDFYAWLTPKYRQVHRYRLTEAADTNLTIRILVRKE